MIYEFKQYDSNIKIYIYAESYLEAKEVLFAFNAYCDKIYNIIEYKIYNILSEDFWELLNVDKNENGYGYPRIISKDEFELLKENGVIEDSINNDTRVVTTKDAVDGPLVTNYPLISTEEFITTLKNNATNISNHKNNIYQMLNTVGDIWYTIFFDYDMKFKSNKFFIYGKSRYQCMEAFENLKNKFLNNHFTLHIKPKLLIMCDSENNITLDSIENYDRMINFMKEHDIKKFPFTTYIKEES